MKRNPAILKLTKSYAQGYSPITFHYKLDSNGGVLVKMTTPADKGYRPDWAEFNLNEHSQPAYERIRWLLENTGKGL